MESIFRSFWNDLTDLWVPTTTKSGLYVLGKKTFRLTMQHAVTWEFIFFNQILVFPVCCFCNLSRPIFSCLKCYDLCLSPVVAPGRPLWVIQIAKDRNFTATNMAPGLLEHSLLGLGSNIDKIIRDIDSRLNLMYKITYDLVAMPAADYLIPNTRQSRHNHQLAYRQIPTLKNYYKYTFLPRTIIHWNAFPFYIHVSPTVTQFSHALCQVVHISS